MHRRISVYIVDRSASKSMSLNLHLVLNSLTYFRSISTASNVHDHLLGLFVVDSDVKGAFYFPCDISDFSPGKPSSTSFRVEQLVHDHLCLRKMPTLLSSVCSELCSDNLAPKEWQKYSPGLYVRKAIKKFQGDLTVI